MNTFLRIGLLSAAGAMAAPVLAHHSLSGQFDVDKSLHLTGVVSRVDWTNPHVYIYVDVKQGNATNTWRIESLPVAMMRKAGLSKNELIGEGRPVELDVHPARNGTPNLGYLLHLKFENGKYIAFSKIPGEQPPP